MKYPLLIPVIGHGATDAIDFPIKSIIYNILSSSIIYNLNTNTRKNVLIVFSIHHLAYDFNSKFNYIISSLLHILMINKPLVAKCYFCFYHTPLHYLRQKVINNKWKYKFGIGFATSALANYVLNNNIDNIIEEKYGKFWWISPVIVHIILNTYQHHKS